MMNRLSPALVFCIAASALLAHHSTALYDVSKPVTVRGTVKIFQWSNPHVLAFVVSEPGNSQPQQTWRLEFTSPGNLTRMGHSKRSLNPGDVISATCYQFRDGSLGGLVDKVTLENGRVLDFQRAADLEKPGLR